MAIIKETIIIECRVTTESDNPLMLFKQWKYNDQPSITIVLTRRGDLPISLLHKGLPKQIEWSATLCELLDGLLCCVEK